MPSILRLCKQYLITVSMNIPHRTNLDYSIKCESLTVQPVIMLTITRHQHVVRARYCKAFLSHGSTEQDRMDVLPVLGSTDVTKALP